MLALLKIWSKQPVLTLSCHLQIIPNRIRQKTTRILSFQVLQMYLCHQLQLFPELRYQ
jgi:hypothetical protein